ncbi:MAG: flagellar basal body P-ring formation chaperone FlgA [Chromatocurvus sp.]
MTTTRRTPLPTLCPAILGLLMLLTGTTGLADNSRQSLDDIRATAEAFVIKRLAGNARGTTASAGRLDPRLRLARCQKPLVAFAVAGDRLKGNTSVGVQCPGTWRLYVPVKVETLRPVLALRHSLDRGKILGPDDLEFVTVDTDRLVRGYYADLASVAGHTLKRSAAGGTILTHALVQEPPVIQRGQRVSLVSSRIGIAVQAPGEALADARIGDRLRVRNLSSGKTVEGVARSSGTVEVY